MKKSVLIILCVIFLFAFSSKIYSLLTSDAKKNANNYWNELNAPIFYGASKITIPINYEFDIKDPRFRVFALDFEDGDLTPTITYSSNVDINTYGSYLVTYEVTDSHNNKTTFNQVVEVSDTNKINVERILYTIPSVSNMSKAGFYRANYADRQILGVYLNSNESIKARVLDSEFDITVQYFADDSHKEGTNTVISKNGEWTIIQNDKPYSSVPLINTNVLNSGIINKTLKIELEYSLDIGKLAYYHYKDNENTFREYWNNVKDDFALIDSERLMVVVPYADISYMTNYYQRGFISLDSFFEYYKKVIEKFDEYVGLSLNPTLLTDQNVRVKYLVKANAHGAGAAYYSTNHVAVNSLYVRSFFERNWGGLHEIAHGYQGSFGGANDMDLGEVSNNILGHYVQIDKDIFIDDIDWLGLLPNIEYDENSDRLNGASYSEFSLRTRLYMIINLLDYFEGPNTYAKMFSWYRDKINSGYTMKNQDAYVEAIADIYNVNITPYLESWGLTINSELKDKLYERNLKLVSILSDVATSNTNSVLNNLGLDEKFGLIDNEALARTNLKGSLTINIDINDISKLSGKKIYIKDNNKVYKTVNIDSSVITIDDLNIGTYILSMPVVDDYTNDTLYVTIKNNSNTQIKYKYTPDKEIDYDNYLSIQILGIYNTVGAEVKFRDNYNKATISLKGALMNNVDSYIKVFDENSNLILTEQVSNNYFDYNKAPYDIDIKPGYIIEVKHPNTSKIKVYSSITKDYVDSYNALSTVYRYIVIDSSLKTQDMSDSDAYLNTYNLLKPSLINIIETYQNQASEYEINNKYINYKTKKKVIDAYNKLSDLDKEQYKSFVLNIIKGGSPIINLIGTTNYKVGDNIDLYSLISASDNEDGEIPINKSSVKVLSNINPYKSGTYKVKYSVFDSDLNESTLDVDITLSGTDKKEEGISVYIDNNYVTKNNYKVKDNKVTINQEYLNQLDDNMHYVKITEDEESIKESIIEKEDLSEVTIKKEEKKKHEFTNIYIIVSLLLLIITAFITTLKRHNKMNREF